MLVESGILGLGILTIAIFGIQVPLPKIRDPVSSTWDPVSTSQDPESKCLAFLYMGGWEGYIGLSLSFQATRFYSHSVLLCA